MYRWLRTIALATVLQAVLGLLTDETANSVAIAAGVDEGSRMFVTKIYPRNLLASDFEQLAYAGFTLVTKDTDITDPTNNSGSLAYMPTYFSGAAAAGLDAATWQGGMTATEGPQDPSSRVTPWGAVSKYVSPHSAAGWQEMGDALVQWAQLSLAHPNYKLVSLDYEFYDGSGVAIDESYHADAFVGYFQTVGQPIPNPLPAPADRRSYLQTQGLVGSYVDYQRDVVRSETRKIRQRIDAINPNFQIGVYGWGSLIESVKEGFATEAAPVVDFSCAWGV
jgi:hypothetical protein